MRPGEIRRGESNTHHRSRLEDESVWRQKVRSSRSVERLDPELAMLKTKSGYRVKVHGDAIRPDADLGQQKKPPICAAFDISGQATNWDLGNLQMRRDSDGAHSQRRRHTCDPAVPAMKALSVIVGILAMVAFILVMGVLRLAAVTCSLILYPPVV
jgi:hypothetical protein